jgi:Uma2 family endonuclease
MKAPELKSRVRLSRAANGMLMTPEEFDAVEEWDERYRYELIRGVVIANPFPSEEEVDPNEELGRLLRNYQESHPQGPALDTTLSERYVRTPDSRRRADRVVWAGLGRLPQPARDPPAIAIEFVSRAKRDRRRDYDEKRREYLDLGVREYWIIDRFRRVMTVFQKDGPERVVRENENYRTPLLPGFELPLARLLAIADQWRGADR